MTTILILTYNQNINIIIHYETPDYLSMPLLSVLID